MNKYLLSISILVIIIAFFLGKDYGSKTELAKCQSKQIEATNVVNEEIKKSVDRRKTNSVVPIDDVWSKLFSKYCSDCAKQ